MLERRFVCQAEDGIRDLVRSRGLGDVYKRQVRRGPQQDRHNERVDAHRFARARRAGDEQVRHGGCLLYTSDAADERSSVDLGGRRIIKKKKSTCEGGSGASSYTD